MKLKPGSDRLVVGLSRRLQSRCCRCGDKHRVGARLQLPVQGLWVSLILGLQWAACDSSTWAGRHEVREQFCFLRPCCLSPCHQHNPWTCTHAQTAPALHSHFSSMLPPPGSLSGLFPLWCSYCSRAQMPHIPSFRAPDLPVGLSPVKLWAPQGQGPASCIHPGHPHCSCQFC